MRFMIMKKNILDKFTTKNLVISFSLALITLIGVTTFAAGEHDESEHNEIKKGPHNGRLLTDGDFSVELAIFERGVPPEYRAWATSNGKSIAPKDWQLNVELTRL